MNEKNLTEALSNLVQLDIDAVYAYDQALKEFDDPIIKDRLLKFQKVGCYFDGIARNFDCSNRHHRYG